MTIKRPILLFLWFLASSLCLSAEATGNSFANILPSEQTEQELQNLSELADGEDSPRLRARPTDIDETEQAQKIPLTHCGIAEISILGIILTIYAFVVRRKKRQLKKILASFFLLFIVGTGAMNAQVIKATADNYYLKPGGLYTLAVTANDNPGDCSNTLNNLVLTITNTPSTKDVTWSKLSGNRIRVYVPLTARGSDVIEYSIRCPSNPTTSSTKVYLNFSERPDFVDDATCTIDPPKTVWDIKKSLTSSHPVHYLASPLAGDLTGNGSPEIVTFGYKWLHKPKPGVTVNTGNSVTVMVFDNKLQLKHEFGILNTARTDTVGVDNYFGHPIALGDVDGDGLGEILVGTGLADDFKLRCYTIDGTQKWASHDKNGVEISYFAYPITHPSAGSATPVIADIDGDGNVEIFIGDRFFDGKTGQLLATIPIGWTTTPTPLIANMPTSFNWGRGYRQQTLSPSSMSRGDGTCQPVLADINGDGRLDAVCGNATYDIKINRANPDLSTATLIASVALPDGLTSVADINGDGVLDVVVVTYSAVGLETKGFQYPYLPIDKVIPTTLYVWDGATNNVYGIVQPSTATGTYGSRAFIGDIDGDNAPEICFTYANRMAAYKYDGSKLNSVWPVKTTTDGSGSTTMTMFDFNLDGETELVYRDQTHIRILDKNGDNVKDKDGNDAVFDCLSATHSEYPIVVDMDGDGHAEIIVSGAEVGATPTLTKTHLMAFTSKTPNMWAPARQVWNQHGYNPLWINKDLSVPRYPANPANQTGYIDDSVHNPFNSFLQQAGWLNVEGKPFNKAPDLNFQLSKNQRLIYDDVADAMTIKVFLTNTGADSYTGDMLLSLYTYTESSKSYFHVHSHAYTGQSLSVYGELELDLVISSWSSIPFPAYDNLIISVNLVNDAPNAPKPFYKNQEECIEWNNMTDKISYVSGSLVMCQGDQAELEISPLGTYDCYWYTLDGGGNKVPYPSAGSEIGDSKTITKLTSGKEVYLIDVYKRGTSDKISTASDSLFVYQSADTLVWTGKINSDWHNPNNWFNPNDPTGLDQQVNIPGSCTNVLIPSNDQQGIQIVRYPNLNAASTDFSAYATARCNNIHFDHGGEVEKIDDLVYSKAYIRLDIESNRWYTFSPPLRNFYSGDIYKTDGNPFIDGVFVYEKLFSQSHPNWGGTYIDGTWGYTFSNPTYEFRAGQGLGVWVDDGNPISMKLSQSFAFPKTDDFYSYYNEDGSTIGSPLPIPDRAESNRFIFEKTINASTKNVSLEVEATTAGSGKEILIGNPFLAHLNFDAFYDANKGKIEPYYRLIDSDGSYATYRVAGASTGNPILTSNIAPMQSILVTPKVAISAANYLIANGSMTVQSPGNKLRSAAVAPSFLRIFISDTELRNRTSLVVDPADNATAAFNEKYDILKVIKSGTIESPNIYLLTADNRYTDIKTVSTLDGLSLRVGFVAEKAGPMAIGFETENIQQLISKYDVVLFDKLLNKEVLITPYQPIYCFEKTDVDKFSNDRFELRFSTKGSGIEEAPESLSNISYQVMGSTFFVATLDMSEIIKDVLVYDLNGRLIYKKSPNAPSLSFNLPSGVFVVKIASESEVEVAKIMIK